MKKITNLMKKISMMKNLNSLPTEQEVKRIEYMQPSLNLLHEYNDEVSSSQLLKPIDLEAKIAEFGFETAVEYVRTGPVVSRYELKLARGVRIGQFRKISEDLSLALGNRVRIQAPVPGTNLIGIEVANDKQGIIGFRNLLEKYPTGNQIKFLPDSESYRLPLVLGTDIVGKPKIIDLAKMPHLLIAGQTGSGKSVCLNSIILSILFTLRPEQCELILVDPKRVEMTAYKNIPHLRCPVVTEPEDALKVFTTLIKEMENRYKILSDASVRNIESFNKQGGEMPYIITVVDEMADLMMTSGKDLEKMIVRIAQLARAVGIHLVLATQKPVVKVITGLIKSNMPSRISFQVASKMDSRVILDINGAEKLLGRGDMLLTAPGSSEPERFHGAWVSDEEIKAVTDFIRGG